MTFSVLDFSLLFKEGGGGGGEGRRQGRDIESSNWSAHKYLPSNCVTEPLPSSSQMTQVSLKFKPSHVFLVNSKESNLYLRWYIKIWSVVAFLFYISDWISLFNLSTQSVHQSWQVCRGERWRNQPRFTFQQKASPGYYSLLLSCSKETC